MRAQEHVDLLCGPDGHVADCDVAGGANAAAGAQEGIAVQVLIACTAAMQHASMQW